MRTAIVSDLHLGLAGDEDILRDPSVRRVLLDEIGGADRLVLLGDAVELRTLPLGISLERARPFFEDLGEAIGEVEVVLVPGNHDHRLAEPLLDRLSLDDEPLGLEHLHAPEGPSSLIDEWLGLARLRIAYPGIWLREDIYATHGHYMDAHLAIPRAECIAAATIARGLGQVPAQATPADYERVLRPLYGLAYGLAQAMRTRPRGTGLTERAREVLADPQRHRSLRARAARAAFPPTVGALNSLLRTAFQADVSIKAITRNGVEAAAELSSRLGLGEVHLIVGHTHRPGPLPDDPEWPLPGGGRLHNTGSWIFFEALQPTGSPPNSYWPGTVTWLENDSPPRRVRLLLDRSHEELAELVN
ncbi:MAG TPA: metallophosphoesterase, partial [Solirubrobacterales bacterium]|nr:metallophosphoesterase [Solirubrobacterales bacterium]